MHGGLPVDFETIPAWGNMLVILGTILLVGMGAHWVVESAAHLAKRLGVSELIIGLTIVAVGTSLPELAASLISALKGHADIAIGAVVGSNMFNLLGVMGLPGLLAPGPVAVTARPLIISTSAGVVFGMLRATGLTVRWMMLCSLPVR